MPALNRSTFRATHNSYSGDLEGGARGSIARQLASGIRLIELDIHPETFKQTGDFQLGHDNPGNQVMHADGNPSSNALADWLDLIKAWCLANPNHAPLQVLLDIKKTITADSAAQGNHGALNRELQHVFGNLLLTPSSVASWPDVSALHGRVFVVFSGDAASREAYVTDKGITPAVSVNAQGTVVEVHESEAGNHSLWYWIGTLGANGQITWKNHGHYGTGTTPAVALNDAGWIVEVHKSQDQNRLWYQVGKVTPDLDIAWSTSHDFDNGVLPTIQFATGSGATLREIHESESHAQNWQWHVSLNTANSSLTFTANGKTSDPRWTSMHAGGVLVESQPDHTLTYTTPGAQRAAIHFEQVAFVEYQQNDPAIIPKVARFAAGPSNGDTAVVKIGLNAGLPVDDGKAFLESALSEGLVTRGWDFQQGYPTLFPPLSYAATDHPYDAWYNEYCLSVGTVS